MPPRGRLEYGYALRGVVEIYIIETSTHTVFDHHGYNCNSESRDPMLLNSPSLKSLERTNKELAHLNCSKLFVFCAMDLWRINYCKETHQGVGP